LKVLFSKSSMKKICYYGKELAATLRALMRLMPRYLFFRKLMLTLNLRNQRTFRYMKIK